MRDLRMSAPLYEERSRYFELRLNFETTKRLMIMNLQYVRWHLATASPPQAPSAKTAVKMAANGLPKAANDDYPVWPLIPFPAGWYASS
jgi:hypothetical protein